jgi:hypothetical protein
MKATELERMKATELESMKAIELDRLSVLLKWRAFGLPSAHQREKTRDLC